ncbi:hypothetical protein [Capybara microvirus Cap3_SP_264]|nr:hypothetical protein [Capybara microvirus Cap3_SP_264]
MYKKNDVPFVVQQNYISLSDKLRLSSVNGMPLPDMSQPAAQPDFTPLDYENQRYVGPEDMFQKIHEVNDKKNSIKNQGNKQLKYLRDE